MACDYTVMRGEDIRPGDVVLTSHNEWTITHVSEASFGGMLLLWTEPERHKPIHSHPYSVWRVRRCTCPTDSDIDAEIAAANDRLHKGDDL